MEVGDRNLYTPNPMWNDHVVANEFMAGARGQGLSLSIRVRAERRPRRSRRETADLAGSPRIPVARLRAIEELDSSAGFPRIRSFRFVCGGKALPPPAKPRWLST